MAAAAMPQRLLWYASVDDVQCPVAPPTDDPPESGPEPPPPSPPFTSEWDVYVSALDAVDRAKVHSFLFPDDQKRALVSVLMQRAAVRCHLQLTSDTGYTIHRTPENKPYAAASPSPPPSTSSSSTSSSAALGHWNYSVSHHGRYVCLGAHPSRLVGVDVVDYLTRPAALRLGSVEQYLGMFDKYLDPREVAAVRAEATEDARFLLFFVTWALKEAYVKAIGLGLKYNLRDVCFTIVYSSSYTEAVKRARLGRAAADAPPVWAELRGVATAVVAGSPRPDWHFEFVGLDHRHLLAVAEGPVEDASESYQRLAWQDQGSHGGSHSLFSVAAWGSAPAPAPAPAHEAWPPPERIPVRALCPPALLHALQALPPPPPPASAAVVAASTPVNGPVEDVACGLDRWEDADVEDCARDTCAQPGDRCGHAGGALVVSLRGRADHVLGAPPAGMQKMHVEAEQAPTRSSSSGGRGGGDGCWEMWRRGGRLCWDTLCVVS
jgi:4'-phosphopantetheinyl transferase